MQLLVKSRHRGPNPEFVQTRPGSRGSSGPEDPAVRGEQNGQAARRFLGAGALVLEREVQ